MEHILPELKYRALVSLRKFHINRCMIELTIEKLTSQKPRKSSYRDNIWELYMIRSTWCITFKNIEKDSW